MFFKKRIHSFKKYVTILFTKLKIHYYQYHVLYRSFNLISIMLFLFCKIKFIIITATSLTVRRNKQRDKNEKFKHMDHLKNLLINIEYIFDNYDLIPLEIPLVHLYENDNNIDILKHFENNTKIQKLKNDIKIIKNYLNYHMNSKDLKYDKINERIKSLNKKVDAIEILNNSLILISQGIK
jgi:hypothetical protein